MPTLEQYKQALDRATQSGDDEATQHFQREIDRGMQIAKQPTDAYGRAVPQGGSILSPVGQGLTFGFMDEIAGGAAGAKATLSGEDFTPAYEETRDDYRQASREYGERNPIASTAAEIGTGLLLPAGALRGLGMGAGIAGSALAGAAAGAGSAEGGVGERATGAGIGAAGGAAVGAALRPISAIGRTFFRQPQPKAEGAQFQADVRTLRNNGIHVTPAEQLASPAGRMDERMVGGYFGTGDDIARRPQQLHGELMRMSNFHPDNVRTGELSLQATEVAQGRFTADYDHLLRPVQIPTANLQPELAAVEARHLARLPHEQRPQIAAIVRDLNDSIGTGRTFSGIEYQRLRSEMGKRAHAASKSELANTTVPLYRDLRRALDTSFNRVTTRQQQEALRAINRQYSGFKILQKTAKNPEGLGTLANYAFDNSRRLNPEFRDLARAYQNVLLRGYPQSSGTAENIATSSALPPVLPMLRSAGTRASAATQGLRLPAPLRGKASAVRGTAGNLAAKDATTTNDEKRKRRRDDDDGDHEYR